MFQKDKEALLCCYNKLLLSFGSIANITNAKPKISNKTKTKQKIMLFKTNSKDEAAKSNNNQRQHQYSTTVKNLRHASTSRGHSTQSVRNAFLAGLTAGVVGTLVGHPLDSAKVRSKHDFNNKDDHNANTFAYVDNFLSIQATTHIIVYCVWYYCFSLETPKKGVGSNWEKTRRRSGIVEKCNGEGSSRHSSPIVRGGDGPVIHRRINPVNQLYSLWLDATIPVL